MVVRTVITPRPYQSAMVEGALALWARGLRRIAGVMATGGGKTVVFSIIARMSRAAGLPVLVLAHRRELIDQAITKIRDVDPEARIGRMQGATKEYRAEVVVGSIQTCCTPTSLALLATRRWGLIVVDETHHTVAPTYLRVLRELGAYKPDGPLVLGVTATLDRTDGLALEQVFEDVIEPTVGLADLIRQGYLVPPRGIRVRIAELDLSRVKRTAGDLNAGQLGAAMTASMAPQRIIEAWAEHAKGRPTVAFLPTIAVSMELAEAFRAAGYRAVHVDGESPDEDREAALKASAAGEMDVICNVNLFGEGTDMPWISCVVLRMTSSGIVYQQQVGRGLRLSPGKKDCVILDPAGVTGRHKLATLASLSGADSAAGIPDEFLLYEDDIDPAQEGDEQDENEDTGAVVTEYADGRLEHELVDLFGQSHSSWLRTEGGRWFLPTAQGFIYLERREHDRYDLCWATEAGWQRVAGRGVIQADMEIGYAMAAGDEYVAARPVWQTSRTAAWRDVPGARGRTKGEIYDDKARERASALLDGPSR